MCPSLKLIYCLFLTILMKHFMIIYDKIDTLQLYENLINF